ncbi:MAG: hypothetical protein GIX01_13975 [Candidatus Eremiobacteraeota bacterium]|nr:hypothetical protein [Candidatus Eremiobacteraeota bacterium]
MKLSAAEVALVLEVSPQRVRSWIRDGRNGWPTQLPPYGYYLGLRRIIEVMLARPSSGEPFVLMAQEYSKQFEEEMAATAVHDSNGSPIRILDDEPLGFSGVSLEVLDEQYFAAASAQFEQADKPSDVPLGVRLEHLHDLVGQDEVLKQIYVVFTLRQAESLIAPAISSAIRLFQLGRLKSNTPTVYIPVLYHRDRVLGRRASAIVRYQGITRLAIRLTYEPKRGADYQIMRLLPSRRLRLPTRLCNMAQVELLYVQARSQHANGKPVKATAKRRRGPRLPTGIPGDPKLTG